MGVIPGAWGEVAGGAIQRELSSPPRITGCTPGQTLHLLSPRQLGAGQSPPQAHLPEYSGVAEESGWVGEPVRK